MFLYWAPRCMQGPRELGPSGGDGQILAQEHPSLQGDARRKPPLRSLKKTPPTNNLAAAVAREMRRDAGGAASRLAEPLPPPQGAILLVSLWGRGARPGNRSLTITFPHCPPLSSEQRAWTRQWVMDNREQQMVSHNPHTASWCHSACQACGRGRVGAQTQLAADPSLAPAHTGFLERGLNWEVRPLRDGKIRERITANTVSKINMLVV